MLRQPTFFLALHIHRDLSGNWLIITLLRTAVALRFTTGWWYITQKKEQSKHELYIAIFKHFNGIIMLLSGFESVKDKVALYITTCIFSQSKYCIVITLFYFVISMALFQYGSLHLGQICILLLSGIHFQ